MMRTLKFLLRIHLTRRRVAHSDNGFTLIELLVAMILAFLVITPLMGFMISVMNTDRQEQAKTTSEQEVQTALDYIARDLQQAIYIYDSTGVDAISAQLPSPTSTDRVPVLVFWKRELVNQAITITGTQKDDTYVYSFVAYYLIKDTSTTWSKAARIARWQISDGVASSGGVTCDGYTGKYVSGYCPSGGFAPFSLDNVGTLQEKMNKWTRLSQYTTKSTGLPDTVTTVSYSATPIVLVDFIDQTDQTATGTEAPAPTCPANSTTPLITWSKVSPASFNTRETGKMSSFYACVDTVNTTAQVFIRGNALARFQTNNLSYSAIRKAYFPTASIRVQGRGYLFTK